MRDVALHGAANVPIVVSNPSTCAQPRTGNALTTTASSQASSPGIDSAYAWLRLGIS
ncbi:MAG: MFS transporter, partial [Mesorhizobium sp.]